MSIEKNRQSILLTGASGKLGFAIQKSQLFDNLLTPELNVFDITKFDLLKTFFENNSFSTIIHCAAQARVGLAEKDPITTLQANIIGAAHLVSVALQFQPNVRFVHISTDGVYQSSIGNYSEDSPTRPYNKYGWTKLGAECSVNLLSNFCVVRTSFFDPHDIPFKDAAVDGYSSKLPLEEFVKALKVIVESDFVGTINIGDDKESDYDRYKKYKPSLKPTTYKDIQKDLPFKLYKNASMNIEKWKKLKESDEQAKIPSTKTINSNSSL